MTEFLHEFRSIRVLMLVVANAGTWFAFFLWLRGVLP